MQVLTGAAQAAVLLTIVQFILSYQLLAPWSLTAEGRHWMKLSGVLMAFLVSSLSMTVFGVYPGAQIVRLVLYLLLMVLMVQQNRLLLLAQLRPPPNPPPPLAEDPLGEEEPQA